MKSFMFSSIQELVSQASKNNDSAYVVFAGVDIIRKLSTQVGENVILCSTSGEFTPEGYKDSSITGFMYSPTDVDVVEIMYPPAKAIQEMKKAYSKVENNPNAFALLLCDGLSAMEEGIVTTFYFTHPNFKIIGGSAGDNLKFSETLIYIGRRKVYSVALFFNSKTKTQLIKENLYEPYGKRMLVTDADPIKRTVKTFNNQPAATEYARVLGVNEKDLEKLFLSNPLGRASNNGTYIASPMKINNDKSITFYSQIIPNSFVNILKLSTHEKVINDTLNSVEFKPSFVLSINCILRSLHFKNENSWKDVDKELLSICKNHTGFVSYGEQFYKNHFNQTMVLLLVE